MNELRLLSYLAPSLPEGLFQLLRARISEATGLPATLAFETRISAPSPGGPNPFADGEADIGFLCAPGYVWMSDRSPPLVGLVGAALVFDDPRNGGRPVYFSDVIVPAASRASSPEDLRDATWAFNDPCSLSGYLNLLRYLDGPRRPLRESGSHLASIRLVAAGEVDAAAVDSNVLAALLRVDPALNDRVRRVVAWGPCAIQPIVARAGLDRRLVEDIERGLCTMHLDARWSDELQAFGVRHLSPVTPADYDAEREAAAAVVPPAK